jgi:hypothetical protein
LASGRAWLAENFDADQMGHEEAWKAVINHVLDDETTILKAAHEVLVLAADGDRDALIACRVAQQTWPHTDPPFSNEELRGLVAVHLVNLRHDGFWDTTSALDPELWDDNEVPA